MKQREGSAARTRGRIRRGAMCFITLIMVLGLMLGMTAVTKADPLNFYVFGVKAEQTNSGSSLSVPYPGSGSYTYVIKENEIELTLDNCTWAGKGSVAGILNDESKPLHVILKGSNSITYTYDGTGTSNGLESNAAVIISGDGKLTITGDGDDYSNAASGICFRNTLTIDSKATVTASGLKGMSANYGIFGGGYSIPTVKVEGKASLRALATDTASGTGYGIYQSNLEVADNAKDIVCEGNTAAIYPSNCEVKNAVSGWSWISFDDVNSGTLKGSPILVHNDFEELTDYGVKSIRFPVQFVVCYYDGGAASGQVPVDNNTYNYGDSVTVLNPGNLAKDGYIFAGWEHQYDSGGGILTNEILPGGQTFIIEENTDLTAKWAQIRPAAIITPPEAIEGLVADGSSYKLVTEGEAYGGTMQYALGKDSAAAPTSGWSTSIPTGAAAGTYYVWYKAVGDSDHGDSEAACVTATISEKPKETDQTTPATIQLNSNLFVRWKDNNVLVNWGTVPSADSYEVWATYCGTSSFELVATVQGGNKAKITKLKGKSLNKKRGVKAYVVAKQCGTSLGRTLYGHSASPKHSRTNAKKVTVKKNSYSLSVGQTAKIKASTVKAKSSKKLLHSGYYRYTSSNPSVATVSSGGKITAVGAGTCEVWVYALNGKSKKIGVTVK